MPHVMPLSCTLTYMPGVNVPVYCGWSGSAHFLRNVVLVGEIPLFLFSTGQYTP